MTRDRAFLFLTACLVLAGAVTFEAGAGSFAFVFATFWACLLFYRNERSAEPLRLPNRAANLLSVAGFALTLFLIYGSAYGAGRDTFDFRVPVVGRYLLFVQWILMFKAHSNRDYAWVYFISVVHVAGSSLLMPELSFAAFFLAYLALAVAAMTVYQQKVEMDRAGKGRLARTARVGWSLLPKSAGAALALMVPAGFFFALLPRGEPGQLSRLMRRGVQPITGFRESVRLGDLGRILQSPERVMMVRVVDSEGAPVPVESLRMRGMALDQYDGRRWRATGDRERRIAFGEDGEDKVSISYPDRPRADFLRAAPLIRCEVTLEPLETSVLFAPSFPVSIRLKEGRRLSWEGMNENLRAGWRRSETLEYYVESRLVEEIMHRAEALAPPRRGERAERTGRPRRFERPDRPDAPGLFDRTGRAEPTGKYLALPENLPEDIRRLATQIVRLDENPTPYQRAERINAYLSDPANFRYTLAPPPMRGEHPIEDFLFRWQEGHCEYFATAMAVLLRCVGVEARLVSGFVGGEWNAFAQGLVFRQRDAHAWVEAYIPPAGWLPFDPSPPAGVPDRQAGLRTGLRNLMDYLDQLWVSYVLAFDHEKQGAFYAFLRKPRDFLHGLMRDGLYRALGTQALLRDDLGAAIAEEASRYRWMLVPLGALLAALVAWFAWRKASRWRLRLPARAARPNVRFYQDLLRLLKRRGFAKPPELTPAEFADRVREAAGPGAEPVHEITWAYYGARYGGKDVSAEQEAALREAMRRTDEALARWRREERRRAKAAKREEKALARA